MRVLEEGNLGMGESGSIDLYGIGRGNGIL